MYDLLAWSPFFDGLMSSRTCLGMLRTISKKDKNDGVRSNVRMTLAICTRVQCNPTPSKPSNQSRSLYLQPRFLALDSADHDAGGVFRDDLVVVQHLEFYYNSLACAFAFRGADGTNLQKRPCPYG